MFINWSLTIIKFPVSFFFIKVCPIFPLLFQCLTIWLIRGIFGHLLVSDFIQHSFQPQITCYTQTYYPTTKFPTFMQLCSTWDWIVCLTVTVQGIMQHRRKICQSTRRQRHDPTAHNQALLKVPPKKWSNKSIQADGCFSTSNLSIEVNKNYINCTNRDDSIIL